MDSGGRARIKHDHHNCNFAEHDSRGGNDTHHRNDTGDDHDDSHGSEGRGRESDEGSTDDGNERMASCFLRVAARNGWIQHAAPPTTLLTD